MALSIQKRWEIVFLSKHEKGPKWNESQVSRYLRIDRQTVRRWVTRYEESGDVQDLERKGRKRKTSMRNDNAIIRLFEKDPSMTLNRARAQLKRRRIEVSNQTISRRLHEVGMTALPPIFKPLLNSNHIKKRLQWCQQVSEIDWNKVVFSDESTFELNPKRRLYWSKGRNRVVKRIVKHPQKIHVWACFCANGFGRLFIFKNNLNALLMVRIYERALLPSLSDFGFDQEEGWLFQQDNDPKHRSRLAKKWFSENHIPELQWPSNSPDLSPIENLWSILKTKVAEKNPSKLDSLVALIKKSWSKFSPNLAQKLIDSMERRIQACRDAHGDFTLY